MLAGNREWGAGRVNKYQITEYYYIMKNTVIKWAAIGAAGICLLIFSGIRISREQYGIIIIVLFAGVLLVYSSFKKIRLLVKAHEVRKKKREEITVYYRDRNQVNSTNTVIPVWSDTFYFYGFLPEANDIKTFRWEGILQAKENGKVLEKEDILKRMCD